MSFGYFAEALEQRVLFGAHVISPNLNPQISVTENPVELNGIVYFDNKDSTHGEELWRTDGTAQGTWMVKDIYPGTNGSVPSDLYVYKNIIYFSANAPDTGDELWRSDGTPQGTNLFKDILPIGNSFPTEFTEINKTLYFFALNPGSPTSMGIWKTDGTFEGTQLVASLPGSIDNVASGNNLPTLNNHFFFELPTSSQDSKVLWVSDGTAAGTMPLATLPTSAGGFIANGNMLYFQTGGGSIPPLLWQTDGTVAGTMQVNSILPLGVSFQDLRALYNGQLYFTANDGIHGTELWSTDGTSAHTTMVDDINPGSGSSNPGSFEQLNGLLYFVANDGVHGNEIWVTNGSAQETHLVVDLFPGKKSGAMGLGPVAGNRIYFDGNNGQTGQELFATDGSASGTVLVQDVVPGPGSTTIINAFALDDTLFFQTPGRENNSIYIVDPPARLSGGTLKIAGDDSANSIVLSSSNGNITATVDGQSSAFSASQVQRIEVDAFAGNDTIEIDDAIAGIAISVNGGDGDDSITVAANDGTLDPVNGAVFISGGDGNDSILFDDHNRTSPQQYLLGNGSFNAIDGSPFLFNTIEQASVIGGNGNDIIYVSPSANTTFTVDGGGETMNQLHVDTFGASGTQLNFAAQQFTFSNRQPVNFSHFVQTSQSQSPRVTSGQLDWSGLIPQLVYTFPAGVTPPTAADVLLLNINTGQAVSVGAPTYNFTTYTVSFPIDPKNLTTGSYQAILRAGSARDESGNPTISSTYFNFGVLAGDANHDGSVDVTDLGIIASQWQQSGSLQGDLNGDGTVNVTDLGILASNWQATLHPLYDFTLPAQADAASVSLPTTITSSKRSATRVPSVASEILG